MCGTMRRKGTATYLHSGGDARTHAKALFLSSPPRTHTSTQTWTHLYAHKHIHALTHNAQATQLGWPSSTQARVSIRRLATLRSAPFATKRGLERAVPRIVGQISAGQRSPRSIPSAHIRSAHAMSSSLPDRNHLWMGSCMRGTIWKNWVGACLVRPQIYGWMWTA
jgi:hypothetical protein